MNIEDICVKKYRKLLYNLQYFCSSAKWTLNKDFCFKGRIKKGYTDFERGFITGRHAAYNEVLRELHKMVEYADIDWNHVHCREEFNE